MVYGEIKKRFMAFWVDIGISTGIIISLFVVFGLTNVIAIIIGATVAAILFLLKDITGRSVGKRIFKLKIIDRIPEYSVEIPEMPVPAVKL